MKLKSMVKIIFEGLNQEKIFNKINKIGVEVFNLQRFSHLKSSFEIEKKYLKEIKKILEDNSIKIIKIENLSLERCKQFIKNRAGIFISIFVCCLFLIFFNSFILKIEIIGSHSIPNSEILEYLDNNQIKPLVLKNSIDNEQLEHNLIENFEDLSLASVMIKGSSLIINVKEKIGAEEESVFQDIVSKYNGRITKINLISGTLNKNVGDLFKVGDVLVYAYCFDSANNKMPVEAKAEIEAEIWFENSITHYEKEVIQVETGEKIVLNNLKLSNYSLFENNKKIPFKNYKTEKIVRKLTNLILPIEIEYIYYKEIKDKEIYKPFDENKEKILAECKEIALQNLEIDDIIKEEKHTVYNLNAGVYKVDYLLVVNKKLS